ncbi:DUF1345 domain-containing protein [Amorphoplanes digitatis]|uniref:Putative membrane protein n=1 Tax=Actinoplanes digitatis TaxID=1868 RepID=A0A7W7HUX9_9ACTN|nr:DUF1345 domain-containing protein [Actinoplanes digitatis]MBB4761247.1 putative membrane protein [Actinoplanes digitatis]
MGTEEDLGRPSWRKLSQGERHWPYTAAIVAMIGLQVALPDRYNLGAWWALPAIEIVVIVLLVAANPRRLERRTPALRRLSLLLIGVASLGTAWSVLRLVEELTTGQGAGSAARLLGSGAAIWLINVLTFAVWYWELDRGGAPARAAGTDPYPDFLFPQMTSPAMVPPHWRPQFADYLYLAFTNATAFSPTDTMPLSRWAKLTMMLEATISLVTAALVIAKAVNALG